MYDTRQLLSRSHTLSSLSLIPIKSPPTHTSLFSRTMTFGLNLCPFNLTQGICVTPDWNYALKPGEVTSRSTTEGNDFPFSQVYHNKYFSIERWASYCFLGLECTFITYTTWTNSLPQLVSQIYPFLCILWPTSPHLLPKLLLTPCFLLYLCTFEMNAVVFSLECFLFHLL